MHRTIPKRTLVLYVPVIHEGYLALFDRKDIEKIYLLDQKLIKSLSEYEPTIATMSPKKVKYLLTNMGYDMVEVVSWRKVTALQHESLLIVDDQLGRRLVEKYLPHADVQFVSVFLRWDREKVFAEESFVGVHTTAAQQRDYMKQAYKVAEQSGDWWRQVGAVVVKNNEILFSAYNQGMPDDHTPYQQGAVRDYVEAGEKPELANTIHAEQKLVALAARQGISTQGADLYVTHFPCPVCAKLIAASQFARCYFSEGSASLDGQVVLEKAGVEVVQVKGVTHD